MEQGNTTVSSRLGPSVQFGKWTFQNAADRLRRVTDPDEIQKFKENSVVFNPTEEEQKDRFRAEFSGSAMSGSPLISDVRQEVSRRAEAAIGRYFDGDLSAEELSGVYQSLSDRLMDACMDRGYPMPLWGGMMGPAFQESFYGEFRRMVLEEAVNRNNAEGRTCITGELTAQGLPLVLSVRRKHRGQGLCYVPDHRTPGRHSGGAQDAANRFLENLLVCPGGYFSRFPQYGAQSMNLRA